MSSTIQMVLSIADNARIDHEAGHSREGAHFAGAIRAAVRRAFGKGWLRVTESSRTEMYAAITDAGRAELARLRGE